jgi:two-component system, OmpR family, response regulator
MRLLLVEDDAPLADALASFLRGKGFAVDRAGTLADARAALPVARWSAVLLDLQLPDGDGSTLVSQIKRLAPETAVIMLTARDQITDRIRGLDVGADDYLVKPFDPDELLARLRAVERRLSGSPGSVITVGALVVDLTRMSVLNKGEHVDLTGKEWSVMRVLASRPERIHTREALLNALYGFDDDTGSNTLEVFISNLRRKLGRASIQTVRGMGYRLTGESD